MPNEHRDSVAGGSGGASSGGGSGQPEEVTERTDYPRLLAVNLGLELRAFGRRLVENGYAVSELGGKLSQASPLRRRAGLAGLDVELANTVRILAEVLASTDDARALIQEQALNLQLDRKR